MRPQRLGVFGGTFDPPHHGHLIIAEEAWYQLHLDSVLWVVAPDPPHKQDEVNTPFEIRLEMVRVAIESDPRFELSLIEAERPGPHYSLDTVIALQQRNPQAELVFIMGGDSLRDLPTWHHPLEFVQVCHALGVVRRPEDDIRLDKLDKVIPSISSKVRFVDAPLIQIAGREIRERVRQGQPCRYFVPRDVWEIIVSRGLYCSSLPEDK